MEEELKQLQVMAKYFEVNCKDGNVLYYKAPDFMKTQYISNYATSKNIRPLIKFLIDYYQRKNIKLIETDEYVKVESIRPQVSVNKIRKEGYIKYNIVTKTFEVGDDETKKVFIDRFCLEGIYLYFTKEQYYKEETKDIIGTITDNYILSYLETITKCSYNNLKLIVNEQGFPALSLELIKF